MSNLEGPSETTTSIGRRCRGGDAYSRAILIARTLSPVRGPCQRAPRRQEHTRQEAAQQRQGMHPHPPAPVRETPSLQDETVRSQTARFHPLPLRGHASVMQTPRPPPRRKAAGDLTTPRRRAPAEQNKELKAATARGLHLFPFRTEKLNPGAPMILRKRESRSPPPPSVPGEPHGSPGTPFCA